MADRIIPTPQERTLLDDDVALPVGYCLRCHKEVVAHVRLARGGVALQWCCVFCDEALLSEDGGLKAAKVPELTARGYRVVAPEAARLHKEGGTSDGEEPSDGGGCGSCSGSSCGS